MGTDTTPGRWRIDVNCGTAGTATTRFRVTGNAGRGGGNGGGSGCHPDYTPCLPIVADLDCGEIDDSLKPIHVIGDDPYGLDGDGNGLGCE